MKINISDAVAFADENEDVEKLNGAATHCAWNKKGLTSKNISLINNFKFNKIVAIYCWRSPTASSSTSSTARLGRLCGPCL